MKRIIFLVLIICCLSLVSCSDEVCEHTWGEWQVGKAATCSENGYSERVCSECGDTDRKVLYATEHPHSDDWVFDGTYHWHPVTCNHKDEKVGKEAHSFSGNKCSICLALTATQGLEYRGNLGEDTYRVTGIGTTLDCDIVVARFFNGYPIVAIDDYAFSDTDGLTSVYIQQYILSVGEGAFMNCADLTAVTLEYGTERIGSYAFSGCSSLTTINFVGTREQWHALEKGDGWDEGMPYYKVLCLDGTIE